MANYKEDQIGEIEALESIYLDELTVVDRKPHHVFELMVTSIEDSYGNQDDQDQMSVVLRFTYTASYPDDIPIMEVKSYENIEERHADEILALMKEQAEENIGMVMVFTIVSAVQERLHEIAERIQKEKEEEKEARVRLEEEAEQKRFEGTRVTIETFLAWKSKFDEELQEERRKKGFKKVVKGQTGKEMFLCDSSMDDSDVKFLEDDSAAVEVDESLFQDLDDLDMGEDLEM